LDYNLKEATAQTTETGIFSLQAPLLCPTDNWEPNDTYDASALISASGIPSENMFDIEQDEDWFRFAAIANGTYTVTTSNLSTSVDTVIELYSQDGRTLLGTDDNGNGGKASQLIWQASSSGIHFIRVVRALATAYGCNAGYSLSLTTQELQVYLPFVQR
jgi:hypothetical protein